MTSLIKSTRPLFLDYKSIIYMAEASGGGGGRGGGGGGGGGSGSGRCVHCSFCCAVCKIACFTCFRGLCLYCFPEPAQREEFSVICLGPGGAGKSTILSQLKGESTDMLEPTMGFSIKDVMATRAVLHVKEVGGSEKIRPYWDKYYAGQQAIVFVVDSSSEEEELAEVAVMLRQCLVDQRLAGLPLLVLCNKQDLTNAATPEELKEKLQVESFSESRVLCVRGCTVKEPSTLRAAIEALIDLLQSGEKIGSLPVND